MILGQKFDINLLKKKDVLLINWKSTYDINFCYGAFLLIYSGGKPKQQLWCWFMIIEKSSCDLLKKKKKIDWMLITATLSHYPVCFGIPPSNFSRRKSPCRRLWLGQLETHLETQPMSWVREINMREISLIQNPWAKSRHLVSLSRVPSNTWNHGGFWYQKALQVVTRVDTVILPVSKPFLLLWYMYSYFLLLLFMSSCFLSLFMFSCCFLVFFMPYYLTWGK